MFNINNISKSYGKKQILKDISFSADKGNAIGILGVNGSGKSTLLTCIATLFSENKDFTVGYLPQENPLFDELKVVDNMKMWCGLSKSEILKALNEAPLSNMKIYEYLDTPVSKMSGGMKKRLSLASVLINQPDLLLLDEPFAALDLPAKEDILGYMKTYLADGGTIIVASHDEQIFNFCNKVYILKNGELFDCDLLKANNISYTQLLRS
ncbi:MAG: ABC transporter ATP-binding protein [Lachnospiraceae bacterium]|nr:ABC transporter ATP-binding protein [Lachnospiraceae bacterium]